MKKIKNRLLWCGWGCVFLFFVLFMACRHKAQVPVEGAASDSAVYRVKFQKARTFQEKHQYDEAIAGFKSCLQYESKVDSVCREMVPVTTDALLQLMNTYQGKGDPEGGVACFDSLIQHKSGFLEKYCSRDLYSLFGYALSRTERMEEAEKMIIKAFSLPLYSPTPERLFRDYAYAAAIFFSNPERQDTVIYYCKKALEQNRFCRKKSNSQWIYSMLGTVYRRTGQLTEAVNLFLKGASDAREGQDLRGEANAYNQLAELYLYWKLPRFADLYASQALQKYEACSNDYPMLFVQTYLLKCRAMDLLDKADSAYYYCSQADKLASGLPYNSGLADVDCLIGSLMVDRCEGDSLQMGIDKLKNVIAHATSGNRAKAFYQLAKGYMKQGKEQKAEVMMDSMYVLEHKSAFPVYVDVDYNVILNHYVKKHDAENVERFALDLLQEYSYDNEVGITSKMYEMMVDFQTENLQQKLQLAQLSSRNNWLLFVLCGGCFLVAVVIFVIVMLYKQKIYRANRSLQDARLDILSQELETVCSQNEQVRQQLSDLLSDDKKREEIEKLTPHLLNEKGEEKFRQRFELLYPHFIPNLRRKAPNLGRREELLCMLIALGQDNFQLEDLLCIAHNSVNMARYRLRQKFGLDKSVALEDYIKSQIEYNEE